MPVLQWMVILHMRCVCVCVISRTFLFPSLVLSWTPYTCSKWFLSLMAGAPRAAPVTVLIETAPLCSTSCLAGEKWSSFGPVTGAGIQICLAVEWRMACAKSSLSTPKSTLWCWTEPQQYHQFFLIEFKVKRGELPAYPTPLFGDRAIEIVKLKIREVY